MRVLSWNLDTNIIRYYANAINAFPGFGIVDRLDAIKHFISQSGSDIIQLQELRLITLEDKSIIDPITPLIDYLTSLNYTVLVCPYNQTGGQCFQYISAFNNELFKHRLSYTRYITKTPLVSTNHLQELSIIKENNYGEEFERCVFINALERTDGKLIFTINCHLSMLVDIRIKSSELINTFVREILTINPNAGIILSGDFNSFVDRRGQEQLDILKETLDHTSSNLAGSSFINYPFDLGAQESKFRELINGFKSLPTPEKRQSFIDLYTKHCPAYGGVVDLKYDSYILLDHFFTHGFKYDGAIMIPTPLNGEPENYKEDIIKQYVLKSEGPAFASDHQIIVVDLY
jgi:endonuclease/exonuclease/phosphatase family metal-dependent hydrolase